MYVQRIRAATLVMNDQDQLLLIKGQGDYWVPPGGALEEGESLPECAARETREESGLIVSVGRMVYVREFVDSRYLSHGLEFFFLARQTGGILVPADDQDRATGRSPRFYSQAELAQRVVYPQVLLHEFWESYRSGFRNHSPYLGTKRV
ncbi:MAG: NUDIX hydrolase [Deinococcus sp.]|nr:NUDIX hydrolase [Deinococcus sp.]